MRCDLKQKFWTKSMFFRCVNSWKTHLSVRRFFFFFVPVIQFMASFSSHEWNWKWRAFYVLFSYYFLLINFTLRNESKHTNLGRLMEKHGSALLGPLYKDPITSYSLFHKFSVQHSEVSMYFNFRKCEVLSFYFFIFYYFFEVEDLNELF